MKTKKIVNISLYVAAGYGVYCLYKKMSSKKSSFSGYNNAAGAVRPVRNIEVGKTQNPNMEGLPGMTGRSLSPSELAARKERGARAMEEFGGAENFFRLPKPTQEEVANQGGWCLCDWIGCATDYCCMSTCCEYCPSQGPSMIEEG